MKWLRVRDEHVPDDHVDQEVTLAATIAGLPTLEDGIEAKRSRSKGGRSHGPAVGILGMLEARLKAHPSMDTKTLFQSIPGDPASELVTANGRRYEVFRDGNVLYQIDDRSSKFRQMTYRTMETHLAALRKKIRNK